MKENDVYNELDIIERENNESNADPSVFFNKTGNPFMGFMHFLKRKPVPPKQIDVQKLMEEFTKFSNKRKVNVQRNIIMIFIMIVIIFVFLKCAENGISQVGVYIFLAVMVALCIAFYVSVKISERPVKHYYTTEDYKNYIIQNCIRNETDELIYEPRFGLPESVYKDLNVIKQGNIYYKEDLITGKYRNIYFAQSDLSVKNKTNNNSDIYFKGRWIGIDYPKKFSGTVIVTDNGFEYGAKRNDLEEIQLENPIFNDMFTVKASDMQLGYYLLTPQLVERFIELRKNYDCRIVVCFKDNFLNIFIDNEENSFEPSICDIEADIRNFKRDFSLVSETIDVLDVNNSVYAQGNARPLVKAPYQSNPNNSSSGIGIQGGRF